MLDLKDFQSQVFKEYMSLRRRFEEAVLFSERGIDGLKSPNLQGMRGRITKILIAFKIKLHNLSVKTPQFIETEKKAEEIIRQKKIKQILCDYFKKHITPDFYKEELEVEVIIALTTLLTKKNIAEDFLIERDTLLFSIMMHKILQKGIATYCLENS